MRYNVLGAAIVLIGATAAIAPAGAQPVPTAESVIASLARNLGADKLRCVTYTGNVGYVGMVGQAQDIRSDWPRVEISNYRRTINFDAKSSSEDITTRQGKYPTLGGGGIPLQGEQRQQNFVVDKSAWNLQGGAANPQPAMADVRAIDIAMTPHGFVKAAMAPGANPVLLTRYENGAIGTLAGNNYRKLNIISFTFGKYRINGTINAENLLERVETRIANPVRGDMNYEAEYSLWKEVDGIKFPGNFHNHTDWDNETQPPNYSGGHNSFGVTVAEVIPNDCGTALNVPANVVNAKIPVPVVTTQTLAPGVTYLTGGSHHSVAVEFRDYIALVEAPQDQARTLAVFDAVHRMYPNKPIKYVVNSHNHFDHLGGIRTAFHEGAVVITHASNKDFYKNEVLSHDVWTLAPDRLSLYPPTEWDEGYQFEAVDTQYTLSDGTQQLQMFYMQGNPHSEGMLFAYLPASKILIEADVYNPPAAGSPPPAQAPAAAVNFYDNVKGYKLDVTTVVGLHGRAVPWSEFLQYIHKN